MNTLLSLIIIVLSIINQSKCETIKQQKDDQLPPHLLSLVQRYSNICKARTDVTEDDIKVIQSTKIPESSSGLCFLQCIMERFGIIMKNKFLKHALVSTFAPVVKNSPEKKSMLKKISDECAEEIKSMETEECGDLAKNILNCFNTKSDVNFIKPLSQIKF